MEDLTRITEFSGLKKELPPLRDYILKVTLAKLRGVWVLLKLPLAWIICLSLGFLNQSETLFLVQNPLFCQYKY